MPIFFDEDQLTEAQRARYQWAVKEYERIQEENQLQQQLTGKPPVHHRISPKSALFARLLEGKQPLPFPPPTSYSYPWYDIIETPGKYQVSIGAPWSSANAPNEEGMPGEGKYIVLNQCAWEIVRENTAAADFLSFMQQVTDPHAVPAPLMQFLRNALAGKPEFILSYGMWGEFRLSLGRVIRRSRRQAVVGSEFDILTLDGGNPVIVKVLRNGTDIRAKSAATLAEVRSKLETTERELTPFEQITLASESAMRHADDPQDDDLVEYDCDGWVLERLAV